VDADAGIQNPIDYDIIKVMVEEEDFTEMFKIEVDSDKNAIVR
jgi:hypothetical protein